MKAKWEPRFDSQSHVFLLDAFVEKLEKSLVIAKFFSFRLLFCHTSTYFDISNVSTTISQSRWKENEPAVLCVLDQSVELPFVPPSPFSCLTREQNICSIPASRAIPRLFLLPSRIHMYVERSPLVHSVHSMHSNLLFCTLSRRANQASRWKTAFPKGPLRCKN